MKEIKSPIDILQAQIDKHPRTGDQLKSKQEVMWVLFEVALNAIEAYHAQFQPTEKTREGAIELARKTWDESTLQVVDNVLEEIIDALIQSGYIQGKEISLEPYPQTENTNTPTLQSDSVDAEQAFEVWWGKEGKFIANLDWKDEYKTVFLAGSKVKPVNEKLREVLKDLLDIWNDGTLTQTESKNLHEVMANAQKVYDESLSIAPDDGWIPVEKIPELNESGLSKQVWLHYPAHNIEGGKLEKYGIGYYHSNPPFNGCNWIDFDNYGRKPDMYLPIISLPKSPR